MNTLKAIEELTHTELCELVQSIYGLYGDIDDMIERQVVASKGTQTDGDTEQNLGLLISQQIKALNDDEQFIDYHDSHPFSVRIESLLSDINANVRASELENALTLTEQLIETQKTVMNRCDDSDGEIGDVYSAAIEQWLSIAAELRTSQPDARNWTDKVTTYFTDNEFSLNNSILSQSKPLLSDEELKNIAATFERQLEEALKSEQELFDNKEAFLASSAIEAVAEALRDIELMEKAILEITPNPDLFQMQKIVEFAIDFNATDRAQFWLSQPGWNENPNRLKRLQGLVDRRIDEKR